jgi:hypothetical protein
MGHSSHHERLDAWMEALQDVGKVFVGRGKIPIYCNSAKNKTMHPLGIRTYLRSGYHPPLSDVHQAADEGRCNSVLLP